ASPRHCERSEAIQQATKQELDCFVARAPRNDGERFPPSSLRHCERSEAIQGLREKCLFHPRESAEGRCQTRNDGERFPPASPRHCERSNPGATKQELDCFVARAPRDDGVRFPLTSP